MKTEDITIFTTAAFKDGYSAGRKAVFELMKKYLSNKIFDEMIKQSHMKSPEIEIRINCMNEIFEEFFKEN